MKSVNWRINLSEECELADKFVKSVNWRINLSEECELADKFE